jgi:hypothetical protein
MSTATFDQKEQKKRLLRAKIAVAIQDETGKVPTEEQIDQVFFLSRVIVESSPRTALQAEGAKTEGTAGDFLVNLL